MPTLELRHSPTSKPVVAPIPFGPDGNEHEGGDPFRVRHLIIKLVTESVRDFELRERDRALAFLTQATIEAGLAKGRIGSPREEAQTVDLNLAIGQALQAFEDRLFLLFVDRMEKRKLDDIVVLRPESVVTVLRLTALAGG